MRYVIAGLFSLCLSLVAGVGAVAAHVPPARQSRILFVRNNQLYAVTPDGAEVTGPHAPGDAVYDLAVSPDGRYLAAISMDSDDLRIFRVQPALQLAEIERLRPGLVQPMNCAWSPDGRYLAVGSSPERPERRRERPAGHEPATAPPEQATPDDALLGITAPPAKVWMLHVLPWHAPEGRLPNATRGLGRAVLPPLPFSLAADPAWAPDSGALAFVRPSAGDGTKAVIADVSVVSLETGQSTVVGETEIDPWLQPGLAVTWSPDGKRLAYTVPSKGILVAPSDGSAPGELLVKRDDQYCCSPCWSPNGTYLAFARGWGWTHLHGGLRVPLLGLWVLELESGRQTDLTGAKLRTDAARIRWSGDGSFLAFYGREARGVALNVYVADPRVGTVSLAAEGDDSAGFWDPPLEWLPPPGPAGDD